MVLDRLIRFYHFNVKVQKLKKLMKSNRVTAKLALTLRDYVAFFKFKLYKVLIARGSLQERFSNIYKYNLWSDNESVSGEGSNLDYTKKIRLYLPQLLRKYAVRSLVDAPCGDFNWMKFVIEDYPIDYTGVDIVVDLVIKNQNRFERDHVRFKVGDICKDSLPACDIVMTRDCLFHLSFADIDQYLKNLSKVDYKYLLTTNHLTSADHKNENIISGDFRLINLFLSPFSIPESAVVERFDDFPDGHPIPREMILIAKQDIPTSLFL